MLMMYTMMDIMFFKIMMYIKIMVYTLNMMYIMNMVYLLLLDSTRYTWCCTGLASLWVCASMKTMMVARYCLTTLGGGRTYRSTSAARVPRQLQPEDDKRMAAMIWKRRQCNC